MKNFDDLIHWITNPYFLALLFIPLLITPFLKFIRRFYSKSQLEEIERSKKFLRELRKLDKYKEDKKLFHRAHLKVGLFLFLPTLIVFILSILFHLLLGVEITSSLVRNLFSNSAIAFMLFIGFYFIKSEMIHKFLFKEDYQKVMTLWYKQSGGEKQYKNLEKYYPFAGYLFFLPLGFVGVINIIFDLGY